MRKMSIIAMFLLVLAGSVGYAWVVSGMSDVLNQRGCCSHHGGVSYCGRSGYFVCADGSISPSCRCR